MSDSKDYNFHQEQMKHIIDDLKASPVALKPVKSPRISLVVDPLHKENTSAKPRSRRSSHVGLVGLEIPRTSKRGSSASCLSPDQVEALTARAADALKVIHKTTATFDKTNVKSSSDSSKCSPLSQRKFKPPAPVGQSSSSCSSPQNTDEIHQIRPQLSLPPKRDVDGNANELHPVRPQLLLPKSDVDDDQASAISRHSRGSYISRRMAQMNRSENLQVQTSPLRRYSSPFADMTPKSLMKQNKDEEKKSESASKTKRTQSAGNEKDRKNDSEKKFGFFSKYGRRRSAVEVSSISPIIERKPKDSADLRPIQQIEMSKMKNQSIAETAQSTPIKSEETKKGTKYDKLKTDSPSAWVTCTEGENESSVSSKHSSKQSIPTQKVITQLISSQIKVFANNAMDTENADYGQQSESWIDTSTVMSDNLSVNNVNQREVPKKRQHESPMERIEIEDSTLQTPTKQAQFFAEEWQSFNERQSFWSSSMDALVRRQVIHLRRENEMLRNQLTEAVDWEVQVMKAYTLLVDQHHKTRTLLERVHAELQKGKLLFLFRKLYDIS